MSDKTQKTIEAYNKNHGNFAAKFMQYAPYVKQVTEFAKLLKDNDRVLDIGCGPGNVAKQLTGLKKVQITGIDLCEGMLETARQNVPQGDFKLMDVREASFLAQSFEAIVLSFCIVHMEENDAVQLLKKAALWLKTGGYLYLSFMEGRKAGFETTCFSEQPIYFNYFAQAKIEKILIASGIECIRIDRQSYREIDDTDTVEIFLFGKKQV